jgi:Domain of unknown function (DUF4365)
VLLDGLGSDLVGEVPEGELGLPEGVGIDGVEEGACELFDLGVGDFTNGLGQGANVFALLRGQGCGRHDGLPGEDGFPTEPATAALVYKDSTNLQDAHRPLERRDLLTWLGEVYPVILVVYDALAEVGYWLYVQAYFERLPRFNIRRVGETVRVRVPTANVVSPAAVRQFAQFRDRVQATARLGVRHHE